MVKKADKRKIRQSPKLPAELRREQLLNTAARLFEKKGYRATSTNEIALAAGLTKGALYYHFKSKEAILVELLRQIMQEHLDGLRRSLAPDMTPSDILRALEQIDRSEHPYSLHHDLDFRAQISKVSRIRHLVSGAIREGCDLAARHLSSEFGRTHEQRFKVALMMFCLWDGLKIREAVSPQLVDVQDIIVWADSFMRNLDARQRKAKD